MVGDRKLVTSNVRGLGSPEKRSFVKEVIKKQRAEIIAIQEMKLDNNRVKTGKCFAQALKMEYAFVPAYGSAGGLFSLKNHEVIKVEWVMKEYGLTLLNAQVNLDAMVPNYVSRRSALVHAREAS